MYSCRGVLVSACLILISLGESFADDTQPGEGYPAHLDWSGDFAQVETRDGSILNEYVAQTGSVNMEGARLIVSMMPRFSCEPMISTVVPDPNITERASVIDLKMTVDEESFEFPSIVDWEKALRRFSLNSEQERHERLRQALDYASWATFEWSVNNVVDSDSTSTSDKPNQGTFDFSLLGSRKTVQDMQDMCLMHSPIPYEN